MKNLMQIEKRENCAKSLAFMIRWSCRLFSMSTSSLPLQNLRDSSTCVCIYIFSIYGFLYTLSFMAYFYRRALPSIFLSIKFKFCNIHLSFLFLLKFSHFYMRFMFIAFNIRIDNKLRIHFECCNSQSRSIEVSSSHLWIVRIRQKKN